MKLIVETKSIIIFDLLQNHDTGSMSVQFPNTFQCIENKVMAFLISLCVVFKIRLDYYVFLMYSLISFFKQ